jgi:hypothetical protein
MDNSDTLETVDLKGSNMHDDDLRKIILTLKRSKNVESVELETDIDESVRDEISERIHLLFSIVRMLYKIIIPQCIDNPQQHQPVDQLLHS